MELLIIIAESIVCLVLIVSFFIYKKRVSTQLLEDTSLSEQISAKQEWLDGLKNKIESTRQQLQQSKTDLKKLETDVSSSSNEKKELGATLRKYNIILSKSRVDYNKLDVETRNLQALQANADKLSSQVTVSSGKLEQLYANIQSAKGKLKNDKARLLEMMSRIDLYSRLDELVSYGHYEEPKYLFKTSTRFTEEIKRIRERQKEMIKLKTAVTCDRVKIGSLSSNEKTDQQIIDGQVKLVLTSFNIDCDFLISKVMPSNFSKSLEQIDKLATKLEKLAVSLHCGFNTEYVKLKYEECKLQYQFTLKKQAEQEEQRIIKEQMREEVRAQKEYDRAVAEAEKEEKMYRRMLEKAKASLEKGSEEDRLITQLRIEDLENQLAEVKAKEERAKSLAQQTRQGHVYIISNIGSFGDGVYKIGLTRRLDPMDRVKELGDASVPFKFDVHAIIHAEDAPALESSLHREFKQKRVNAVNYRKEFFYANIEEIKEAAIKITGKEIDFRMTALAEEYYETKRLQRALIN